MLNTKNEDWELLVIMVSSMYFIAALQMLAFNYCATFYEKSLAYKSDQVHFHSVSALRITYQLMKVQSKIISCLKSNVIIIVQFKKISEFMGNWLQVYCKEKGTMNSCAMLKLNLREAFNVPVFLKQENSIK